MKKITVLVLGVGGNVGQGIIKALKHGDMNLHIIGACVSQDSLGLFWCDEAYVSPFASDENFMPWLISICNRKKVDIVLTGVEEIIIAIETKRKVFESGTGALFIATALEKLIIGQDKYLTCKWLQENGCNVPKYCLSEDFKESSVIPFPLVAKPRCGKGSNGVFFVHDKSELRLLNGLKDYVIEECVGTADSEYTVGCYRSADGMIMPPIIMKRELEHGSTKKAVISDNHAVREEALRICQLFKPNGPLNIQMRLDSDGRAVCFELNVRFSGTTPMRSAFGFKDVKAMIKEYVLHEDISDCFSVRKGIAVRYTNEMYITAEQHYDESSGLYPTLKAGHVRLESL